MPSSELPSKSRCWWGCLSWPGPIQQIISCHFLPHIETFRLYSVAASRLSDSSSAKQPAVSGFFLSDCSFATSSCQLKISQVVWKQCRYFVAHFCLYNYSQRQVHLVLVADAPGRYLKASSFRVKLLRDFRGEGNILQLLKIFPAKKSLTIK